MIKIIQYKEIDTQTTWIFPFIYISTIIRRWFGNWKKWSLAVSKFLSLGGHQASGSTTYAAASIKVLLCIRYDMEWESSFKILSVLRACMPFFGWVLRYTAVSQGAGGNNTTILRTSSGLRSTFPTWGQCNIFLGDWALKGCWSVSIQLLRNVPPVDLTSFRLTLNNGSRQRAP